MVSFPHCRKIELAAIGKKSWEQTMLNKIFAIVLLIGEFEFQEFQQI